LFHAFVANKFIYKENYVFKWEILQNNLQPQISLPAQISTQYYENCAITLTCATYQIHYLSGKILNIITEGKRPNVKAKVNGYGRNFLYDTGASRTCMTMNTFQNAFPNGTPRKLRTNSISDELY